MIILAYLCYAFAVIDVVSANIFGFDMTGVVWSPIAAVVAGSVLKKVAGK